MNVGEFEMRCSGGPLSWKRCTKLNGTTPGAPSHAPGSEGARSTTDWPARRLPTSASVHAAVMHMRMCRILLLGTCADVATRRSIPDRGGWNSSHRSGYREYIRGTRRLALEARTVPP